MSSLDRHRIDSKVFRRPQCSQLAFEGIDQLLAPCRRIVSGFIVPSVCYVDSSFNRHCTDFGCWPRDAGVGIETTSTGHCKVTSAISLP